MNTKIACFLFLVLPFFLATAQTAEVRGKILDENNQPIENASVSFGSTGISSDANGNYTIKIPANSNVILTYSHVAFESISKVFRLNSGKILNYSPKLKAKTEEIEEVIVREDKVKADGNIQINTKTIQTLPSANQGVESVLKTLPGVNFNNELSTQYNVRGGSFEENLVYVNGIEVYRPFLIRSGQQEGLSFVNPQMTQNVNFSAGGFQARYGDKLSSVLDITYKKPEDFGVQFEASLLGASLALESNVNEKLQILVGARYRNNSLFVNNDETKSNFNPIFTDIQSYLSYRFTEKFALEFLGSYAENTYNFTPITRKSNIGTVLNPFAIVINYEGKEEDQYKTLFGALRGIYQVSDQLLIKLTSSSYQTREQEHYDIIAAYGIGDVDTDFGSDEFGEVDYLQSIGQQHDHGRNDLKAQISNIELKADYRKGQKLLEMGLKYQIEDFQDQVIEWQMIDSAGFSVRPPNISVPNEEPYTPYTAPIVPFTNVRAFNDVQTNRMSGFVQFSDRIALGSGTFWYNLGVRMQHWSVEGEGLKKADHTVVSPRAQMAWRPNVNKDLIFRLAGGYYHQPPFYRELRDSLGVVQPSVKAQESIHVIVGTDFSFLMWNRPFKITGEAYYKYLTDVNPFTIDNVRIRYRARNNAVAYATGFDFRINGEFVPGTQSWFSFGYLVTKEDIENRGYISRPTDQRLKFALLFQDYVPSLPNLKMYLNMVYNTGVPGGSPSYADPYLFQNRLKDYFRSDIGISYVFVDENNRAKYDWQEKFKELSAGIELFNMFDVQNSITNTWVTDISTQQSLAVPNYLSPRVLNLKISMKF